VGEWNKIRLADGKSGLDGKAAFRKDLKYRIKINLRHSANEG
jgi:hypothetical protein